MRPKKIILLYCCDLDRRAVLSFLLTTRGYRVIDGVSESAPVPDAAVFVDDPSHEPENVAKVVDRIFPDLPMAVVTPKQVWRREYPVRAWMLPHDTPPVGLLERIRLMCARKRGPKKAIVREQVSA